MGLRRLTLCLDRDVRVRIALKTISEDPEGRILFLPLLFGQTEKSAEFRIHWTTRARAIEASDFEWQTRQRKGPLMDLRDGACRATRCVSEACAVCLSRAPDCELQPCGHARCCRRCVVETVCTWRQTGPPRCALCRAPFHTMVFLE